jgi:hypothetical protein
MGNEVDDPMGVLVGELLYQHAVDDREDRGRRRDADAERQRRRLPTIAA